MEQPEIIQKHKIFNVWMLVDYHHLISIVSKYIQNLSTWDIGWFWLWSNPRGTGATCATGAVIGLTADISGGTLILGAGEGILWAEPPAIIPEELDGGCGCEGNWMFVELNCEWLLWCPGPRGESPLAEELDELPSPHIEPFLYSFALFSIAVLWRLLRFLYLL